MRGSNFIIVLKPVVYEQQSDQYPLELQTYQQYLYGVAVVVACVYMPGLA